MQIFIQRSSAVTLRNASMDGIQYVYGAFNTERLQKPSGEGVVFAATKLRTVSRIRSSTSF
jgi:hypothetical protein